MESEARLTPVAVRDDLKLTALDLVMRGYDQAMETVTCPDCDVTYLLLFDPRDNDHMQPARGVHKEALEHFRRKISIDHSSAHSLTVIRFQPGPFPL